MKCQQEGNKKQNPEFIVAVAKEKIEAEII